MLIESALSSRHSPDAYPETKEIATGNRISGETGTFCLWKAESLLKSRSFCVFCSLVAPFINCAIDFLPLPSASYIPPNQTNTMLIESALSSETFSRCISRNKGNRHWGPDIRETGTFLSLERCQIR
ncbi:hypothetical protein CEXT_570691 [Caerostris extrusa]|uniref:Uncharacterized protein n=1 Tax=Caerostris extrusa TaxID=172846 RepID=A0AAV4Y3W0_CAEEX|nr:hypothetical protein CEXT_570691 [Caerostris extrusa]